MAATKLRPGRRDNGRRVAYNPFTTDINSVLWVPLANPDPPLSARFAVWAGGQSKKAHGGGAVQYWEWNENKWGGTGDVPVSHVNGADTLRALKAVAPGAVTDACLECHSGDYILAEEAGQTTPTSIPPRSASPAWPATYLTRRAPKALPGTRSATRS